MEVNIRSYMYTKPAHGSPLVLGKCFSLAIKNTKEAALRQSWRVSGPLPNLTYEIAWKPRQEIASKHGQPAWLACRGHQLASRNEWWVNVPNLPIVRQPFIFNTSVPVACMLFTYIYHKVNMPYMDPREYLMPCWTFHFDSWLGLQSDQLAFAKDVWEGEVWL